MRARVVVFSLLTVINALFFWKIIFTDQFSFLIDWDNANQVFPWAHFVSTTLQNGDLPVWDPYIFAGRSFVGEMQTGLFDLLRLPLYTWPWLTSQSVSPRLVDLFVVGCHLLACWLMFLLAAELRLGRFAGLVAASVFGLGGFVGNLRWPGMLSCSVWLPLIFLFALRAAQSESIRRRLFYATLAGFALGLVALAGSIHILIADLLFLGAFVLYVPIWGEVRRRSLSHALARSALVGVVLVAVGFSAGAAQLLPSIEYAGRSVRWVGELNPLPTMDKIPYDLLSKEAALPPSSVLNLVIGGYPVGSSEFAPYFGILPFLLSIIGVWEYRSDKWVRFLAALAALSFFYALGENSLLHGVLYGTMPFLDKAREAGRLLYLTHFSTALLAGFGAEIVFRLPSSRSESWTFFLRGIRWATWLAAGSIFGAFLLRPEIPEHVFLSLVFLVASYAILTAASRGRTGPTVRLLAIALVLADLGAFHKPIKNMRQESKSGHNSLELVLEARELAEFFHRQEGWFRVSLEDEDIRNMGDLYGVDTINGGGVTVPENFYSFLTTVPRRMDLLNVRYTVTNQTRSDEEPVFTLDRWQVYEHQTLCPRAWIVRDHCCPVKSRIESIGWGHRGIRFGSRMAGVPVKGAFFRIA